ncbi:hypothetical protein BKA70DRAFT_1497623 [Coprinopsis sp. MPI-PUGE-AT-0042]|nr:hypothetical protein BKA70DRAFT_1497623 [Coprinopsis sp. MPI-PUGE-AT-0042]
MSTANNGETARMFFVKIKSLPAGSPNYSYFFLVMSLKSKLQVLLLLFVAFQLSLGFGKPAFHNQQVTRRSSTNMSEFQTNAQRFLGTIRIVDSGLPSAWIGKAANGAGRMVVTTQDVDTISISFTYYNRNTVTEVAINTFPLIIAAEPGQRQFPLSWCGRRHSSSGMTVLDPIEALRPLIWQEPLEASYGFVRFPAFLMAHFASSGEITPNLECYATVIRMFSRYSSTFALYVGL